MFEGVTVRFLVVLRGRLHGPAVRMDVGMMRPVRVMMQMVMASDDSPAARH